MTSCSLPLLDEQIRRNAAFRDAWERYSPHRNRVTELLLAAAPPSPGTLAILGAGNCNDIDLLRLLTAFSRIRLIDCDLSALSMAVSRQGLSDNPAVELLGSGDLSGIAGDLANWPAGSLPSASEVTEAIATARLVTLPVPDDSLDVVASVCLLSQLLEPVARLLSLDARPGLLELLVTIRRQHLALMLQMLKPGGRGVLISDVVSSDTAAELCDAGLTDFSQLLARLIRQKNFFTGLNPAVIIHELRFLASNGESTKIEPISPWLWDAGPRCYAVFGIEFEKAALLQARSP